MKVLLDTFLLCAAVGNARGRTGRDTGLCVVSEGDAIGCPFVVSLPALSAYHKEPTSVLAIEAKAR